MTRDDLVSALKERYGFVLIDYSGDVISQSGRWEIRLQIRDKRTGLYIDGVNVCGFRNDVPVRDVMMRIQREVRKSEEAYQRYMRETAAERAEIQERVARLRACHAGFIAQESV